MILAELKLHVHSSNLDDFSACETAVTPTRYSFGDYPFLAGYEVPLAIITVYD